MASTLNPASIPFRGGSWLGWLVCILVVHADQRQFSVRDSGSRLDGSGWTAAGGRVPPNRGGAGRPRDRDGPLGPGGVLGDAAPLRRRHWFPEAEHAVEADLPVPSGKIVISGPADYPTQEKFFSVLPGRYRARVSTRYRPAHPRRSGTNTSSASTSGTWWSCGRCHRNRTSRSSARARPSGTVRWMRR